MAFIYGLTDPTGAIRYVGFTSRTLDRRLVKHLQDAQRQSKKNRHVYTWIRSLLRNGHTPEIVLLDECEGNGAEEERMWIKYGRECGWRLTNHTDGGEGTTGFRFSEEAKARLRVIRLQQYTPELRKKLSEAAKRRGSNVPTATRRLAATGKKHTEETRKLIGDARRGKTASAETRKRMSESMRKRKQADKLRNNLIRHLMPEVEPSAQDTGTKISKETQ